MLTISESLQREQNAILQGQSAPTAFFSSLRSRGYLFILLVLLYILSISVFFFSQREQPLEQLEQYQKILQTQDALVQADLAAFHVVTVLFSDVTQAELNQVLSYFSTLRQQYRNLYTLFPEQAETFRKLEQSIPQSRHEPGEAYLQKVHLHLARSKNELDRLMSENQTRLTSLVKQHRQQYNDLILQILILGIIGLTLIGMLTTLFFNRLKTDLLALLQRTTDIVQGYRGKPLPVNRRDELGQLTEGVNVMSQSLTDREKDLEIERRKSSFREKMLAIDALTGGIAHEVANPITCIVGLAQEITSDQTNRLSKKSRHNLSQLNEYTENLVRLTRDLAIIDSQHPDESEWIDINQHLSNTAKLYHYDKRWAIIDITLNLDPALPALFASVNPFNQLITHLLENAWDAVATQPQPAIYIQTKSSSKDSIHIIIEDNGNGVDAEKLAHIFEPFYTTKAVGQGTGLGLTICRSIVRALLGSIEAGPSVYGGLKITMQLPVNSVTTGT